MKTQIKKNVIDPEVVKSKNNNSNKVLIINKHLHIHQATPKRKLIKKPMPPIKKCYICGTHKRTFSNFCSQNCYNKYQKYQRDKFRDRYEDYYSINKSWWEFWK